MNGLIAVESMFGNTEQIARAIATGLAPHAAVHIVGPDRLTDAALRDADFVVIGGPTHGWSVSRKGTRETALRQAGRLMDEEVQGLRESIIALREHDGMPAAAFCTRLRPPRIFTGSAARAIARKLKHKRFDVVVPAEDFLVVGTAGPLVAGEIERAQAFGASVGAAVALSRGRRRAA